ncbi:hypothetical protein [Motilibacter deserti]|uniref:Uncharacterized protein n=1 Tax=Motilibacter deserti TaxID=2714956 RepID=A0ABX0H2A1_9ACTN|nr:hypothetical protein [Motilibacter deserti]NHC16179.1 hypothetical protein [Motilibacter deserti]
MSCIWLSGGGPYDNKDRDLVLYPPPQDGRVVFDAAPGKPFAEYVETADFHDSTLHGRCRVFRYVPQPTGERA